MRKRNQRSKVEDIHERAAKMVQALKVAREQGKITPSHTIKGRTMAEKLNKFYGWNLSADAGVRELVNHARSIGLPVAGDGNGYFYAINSAEIEPTLADLKSRIARISEALHGLEKACKELMQIEADLFQRREPGQSQRATLEQVLSTFNATPEGKTS